MSDGVDAGGYVLLLGNLRDKTFMKHQTAKAELREKDHRKIGKVYYRHLNGQHSRCQVWDTEYLGFICRYTWEPYGKTAHELAIKGGLQ